MIQDRIHKYQNKKYKISPERNRIQNERLGLYTNGKIQNTRLVLLRVEYRIKDQFYEGYRIQYQLC